MKLGLEGSRAVVTGAGGAIGGSIAEFLVKEGARVAIWDISAEKAGEEAKKLGTDKAFPVTCDVTNHASIKVAMEKSVAQLGGLDILVNCAGGSHPTTTTSEELPFFDILPDDMRRIMDLNYLSAVMTSQEAGRIFAGQKKGAILNISSIAGIIPVTRGISYSNGKAATNSLTKWLAVHMATNYSPDIRVNAVAPGFLLTEQNRFLLFDEKTGEPSQRGRTVMSQVPMRRYGTPQEIAAMAVFLVSEPASFITGSVVPVDGGLTSFLGV
ncbi:SDR family oxidoreductase [Marispirochaeta aestuarii]|uniref:SDR family oxidoreductase n=1 Tax=Marispirochaeta aestuarii TaxID=1963862 RepID=UPI0029C8408C|nr:SDR family oxidoreductase [Marispirochaeta aestuarii]